MENLIQLIKEPVFLQYLLLIINMILVTAIVVVSNNIRKGMKDIINVTDLQLKASEQMEKTFNAMINSMISMIELRKEMDSKDSKEKIKKISS